VCVPGTIPYRLFGVGMALDDGGNATFPSTITADAITTYKGNAVPFEFCGFEVFNVNRYMWRINGTATGVGPVCILVRRVREVVTIAWFTSNSVACPRAFKNTEIITIAEWVPTAGELGFSVGLSWFFFALMGVAAAVLP
jgi:hypothetical protein